MPCTQAHLEFYRGNFSKARTLYDAAIASAEARGDKQIINRCNAGIAAVLLVTDEVASALTILKHTNSFGQLALALLRSGQKQEALEQVLQVKDRFKGKRTKYYVLKAFASAAEVDSALVRPSTNLRDSTIWHDLLRAPALPRVTPWTAMTVRCVHLQR